LYLCGCIGVNQTTIDKAVLQGRQLSLQSTGLIEGDEVAISGEALKLLAETRDG